MKNDDTLINLYKEYCYYLYTGQANKIADTRMEITEHLISMTLMSKEELTNHLRQVNGLLL